MVLWLAGELARLDFGFEFHTILLWVRTFEVFGAGLTSRNRHTPRHRYRTMVLWLLESLPALILVLSFIALLLWVRTFETFGAQPHFAGSVHARRGLTNDGVVVRTRACRP